MKFHGDWLPEATQRFRIIEEVFRHTCLLHGYGEVRTPVIEKLHWFTGAGILSPDLMNKIYTFLDWDGWSGERVVLRPDNTVPVCRLFSQYFEKKGKSRLFYIEDVFRYDEKEKIGGRHCQMGVELLGNFPQAPVRDVEILTLLFNFLTDLKLGRPRIVLGHAGILHSWLKSLNLSESEESMAFDLLLEGRTRELRRFCEGRTSLEGLNRLLELRGSSRAFLTNLKSLGKLSTDFTKTVGELETIARYLETLGYPFEIFPGIHKDLTYYTGLMFDIYLDEIQIGGGGRYDSLLEKFTGKKIGGSGFSIYVEPLMEFMKIGKEKPSIVPLVFLKANLDREEIALQAMKTAATLRKRGLAVRILSKKERPKAGGMVAEIGKAKGGFVLKAGSGRGKETFPLPLKSVKKLLTFWGIKR